MVFITTAQFRDSSVASGCHIGSTSLSLDDDEEEALFLDFVLTNQSIQLVHTNANPHFKDEKGQVKEAEERPSLGVTEMVHAPPDCAPCSPAVALSYS